MSKPNIECTKCKAQIYFNPYRSWNGQNFCSACNKVTQWKFLPAGRCEKHDVKLDRYQGKENVCFICENERRANQRHLAEQRAISEVRNRFRSGTF